MSEPTNDRIEVKTKDRESTVYLDGSAKAIFRGEAHGIRAKDVALGIQYGLEAPTDVRDRHIIQLALDEIFIKRGKLLGKDKEASERLWDAAKTIKKYFNTVYPA